MKCHCCKYKINNDPDNYTAHCSKCVEIRQSTINIHYWITTHPAHNWIQKILYDFIVYYHIINKKRKEPYMYQSASWVDERLPYNE